MKTIILLPPSQGKAKGGDLPSLNKVHPITKDLLKKISVADENKLYGLKEKALVQASTSNKGVLSAKTLPAIFRYTGVVYDAIDYASLKNKDLFNERVRIVSGLFGLVKPLDTIPEYNLKIDKLGAAQLWCDENTSKVKDCFVIDLLPKAHKKAIRCDKGVVVDFVIVKNGKRMPAGHQGKHIKGRFVRWLIENDIASPDDFATFSEDGFVWDGSCFVKLI